MPAIFRLFKRWFLTLLILNNFIFAYDSWKVQNPLPTEAYLLKIEPVTDNTIFIGGLGGTLLKTIDGGETWTVRKFKDLANIRGISFIDSLNGWIMDSHKLYQTNDGGTNWKVVYVDVDLSTYVFLDIACFENVIYLVLKPRTAVVEELIDAKSLVLKSMDGGKTWKQLDLHIPGKMLCMFFLNDRCGFLYVEETKSIDESYTTFYKTCDGGKTWEKSEFPENHWTLGMYFINGETGFVGQYRTTDGGETWENVLRDYVGEVEYIDDIFFADSLQGWALNWFDIFQTVDGGLTWQAVEQKGSYRLMDINFSENRTGWIVGWACNIYRKKPDKNVWEPLSTGPRNSLHDVFFINEKHGWCVGSTGCILHTENGGEVWEQQQSNVNDLLLRVKFLNQQKGFAIGYKVALHTEDSGNTWQKYNDLNSWYTDIDFFDDMNGLLIEQDGTVFRTINGGKDWQVVAVLSNRLTSLEILNENEAWIGGRGCLAHVTDKGKTIQWIDYLNLSLVQDIQFIDKNRGWLLDDDDIVQSALFTTCDGGKTWQKLPRGKSIEDGPITAFFMQDSLSGWIYSYDQGGYLKHIIANQVLSAIEADEYGVHPISAIFFINSNLGWAVGAGGTILKYTRDTESPVAESHKRNLNIFPNPFDETGVYITFILQQPQFVKVEIFNIIGQKVQTLFSGWLNEGDKTLFWVPNGIASGVYCLSVQCNEFNQTQKCTYIHH